MSDRHPPDRGHLLTEHRNDATRDIDALDTADLLALMVEQDAAVIDAVRSATPALAALIDDVVEGMSRNGRLIYLGAGTSGRLGVLDASECPPTFFTNPAQVVGIIAGGGSALRTSSEGAEDDPDGARSELERLQLREQDTVIGIAAGGTTPYVVGAIEIAKQRGATTALITCAHIDRPTAADHLVVLAVGPEVVTGSTRLKAGTATKLALNTISTATMIRLGKTWGNLMVDLRASNVKLRDRAMRILAEQCDVSREEAEQLLDAAGGRVKLALVMALRGVDAEEAGRMIDEHAGRLRPLLGPPR